MWSLFKEQINCIKDQFLLCLKPKKSKQTRSTQSIHSVNFEQELRKQVKCCYHNQPVSLMVPRTTTASNYANTTAAAAKLQSFLSVLQRLQDGGAAFLGVLQRFLNFRLHLDQGKMHLLEPVRLIKLLKTTFITAFISRVIFKRQTS